MIQIINKILYIPSPKMRVVNLVVFVGMVLLMISFHFVSTPLDFITTVLQQSDPSRWESLFLLLIGFSISFVIIYLGVDRYFLGWRHAFCATVGTTVLVSIAYGVVWSLFEIGQGKQSFVFLLPHRWNLSDTLNNLKAGTLLAIFSSIGLSARFFLKDEYAHDFIGIRKNARDWKLVIRRRFTNEFGQSDHDRLLNLTRSMLDGLDARNGWIQPAVEESAKKLTKGLEEFLVWYSDQTFGIYTEFRGFDQATADKVRQIEKLC